MRLALFFSIILLGSCLSSRKADKQLSRLMGKFPAKIAKECNKSFPCFVNKIDTTFIDTTLIVNCDTTIVIKRDTTIIQSGGKQKVIRKKKIIKVHKKVPVKVQVPQVIRYYEDSAKIVLCREESNTLKKQLAKQDKKHNFLYGVISALSVILLFLIYLLVKK